MVALHRLCGNSSEGDRWPNLAKESSSILGIQRPQVAIATAGRSGSPWVGRGGPEPRPGHAPLRPLPIGRSPKVPPPNHYKAGGEGWRRRLEFKCGVCRSTWGLRLNAPG